MALVASRGACRRTQRGTSTCWRTPEPVRGGTQRREMVARPVEGEERDELWQRLTAAYPHFDAYQRRTDRATFRS